MADMEWPNDDFLFTFSVWDWEATINEQIFFLENWTRHLFGYGDGGDISLSTNWL